MFQSAEITLRYNTLFYLSLKHHYFTQPLSKDFSFVPTTNTNILMQKMNGLAKPATAQTRLFYDFDRIEGIAKFLEQNKGVKFSFWILCKNLYFTNFTAINHLLRGGGYYFKNNSESDLLHTNEMAEASNYYPIAPSSFVFATSQGSSINVLDSEENVLLEAEATSEKFQVSLQKLPEGLYHLQEDGKIKNTFLHYTNLPASRPIGLVDLWINDDWKEHLLSNFNEGQVVEPKQFEIRFSNRSTYWRYFVILRFQKNGEDSFFSITSDNKEITFDASGSIDKEGNIRFYFWNFGDSSDEVYYTVPTTTHTYSKVGTYTLTTKVKDAYGAESSAEVTVHVVKGNSTPSIPDNTGNTTENTNTETGTTPENTTSTTPVEETGSTGTINTNINNGSTNTENNTTEPNSGEEQNTTEENTENNNTPENNTPEETVSSTPESGDQNLPTWIKILFGSGALAAVAGAGIAINRVRKNV